MLLERPLNEQNNRINQCKTCKNLSYPPDFYVVLTNVYSFYIGSLNYLHLCKNRSEFGEHFHVSSFSGSCLLHSLLSFGSQILLLAEKRSQLHRQISTFTHTYYSNNKMSYFWYEFYFQCIL